MFDIMEINFQDHSLEYMKSASEIFIVIEYSKEPNR
jgi:hypothetical protein